MTHPAIVPAACVVVGLLAGIGVDRFLLPAPTEGSLVEADDPDHGDHQDCEAASKPAPPGPRCPPQAIVRRPAPPCDCEAPEPSEAEAAALLEPECTPVAWPERAWADPFAVERFTELVSSEFADAGLDLTVEIDCEEFPCLAYVESATDEVRDVVERIREKGGYEDAEQHSLVHGTVAPGGKKEMMAFGWYPEAARSEHLESRTAARVQRRVRELELSLTEQ